MPLPLDMNCIVCLLPHFIYSYDTQTDRAFKNCFFGNIPRATASKLKLEGISSLGATRGKKKKKASLSSASVFQNKKMVTRDGI